ncbi:hypothetical protein Z043_100343 [Scleropages formosus]|uniref:Glycine N-acyltransferase-like protein n=1 Tax=Scleropages formosus TaxID=113540 RepID=A0A0P7XXP1_SCLFO|nr:hypothetical protein Z043_100343 [Scleropages formosus]
MVNATWTFGGDEQGFRNIKNLIERFPTCCIVDEKGQPVSWVLVCNYCTMGMLYTVPEHRGEGLRQAPHQHHVQEAPQSGLVYCFIEEENQLFYRIFRNLGFTEDPAYRAAWFEFTC